MASHDSRVDEALVREGTAQDNAIPKADLCLDATGQEGARVPALIEAQLTRLEIGGVLEVVSDDPSAREVVLNWVRHSGQELVATLEQGERHTRFYILRKEGPTEQRDPYS